MSEILGNSLIDEARNFYPGWEHTVYADLGATATFIMPGAPRRSAAAITATSFTSRTRGTATAVTMTPRVSGTATALYSWGTPFDLTKVENFKGTSPFVTFNGSTELISTPDAAYFTTAAGGGSFSFGLAISPASISGTDTLWAKWHDGSVGGTAGREWRAFLADGKVTFEIYDETADAYIGRLFNTALAVNQWNHLVFTYDGTTGTASSDLKIYLNGAAVDDTNSESGVFVTMRNTASLVSIGASQADDTPTTAASWINFYAGRISMAPGACPFYTQVLLTAAQAKNRYLDAADALGL